MSAGAPERDLQPPSPQEKRRQAGLRLRRAHDNYERFAAVTPLTSEDVKPHPVEEMKAAREELEAAREGYAKVLREDPDFRRRSEEAERRLAEGPPWDDAFSPSELLKESGRPDR